MNPSGIPAGRLLSIVLSLTLHAATLGAVLHWLDDSSQRGCPGDSPVFTLQIGLPATAPHEESSSGQDNSADLPAPPSPPLPSTAEFAHIATAREGPAPAPAKKSALHSRIWEILVTPQGNPAEIRVKRSSGYPAMDQSALQSVRGWKFHPALSGKEPVSCRVEVPVRFQLRKA